MPLVKAQCTNCGGTLEVDNSKEAAICPFCNTPYIVEKAINNFNAAVTINAENVVISASASDFKVNAGRLIEYNGLQSVVNIPEGVVTINESVFSGSAITEVNMPKTLKRVEKKAFMNCTSLKKVSFASDIEYIKESAFSNCTSLTDIKIPDSITVIEEGVFSKCRSLTRIELPKSLRTIRGHAFGYCENLVEVKTIPYNSVVYGSAFKGCSSLNNVKIDYSFTIKTVLGNGDTYKITDYADLCKRVFINHNLSKNRNGIASMVSENLFEGTPIEQQCLNDYKSNQPPPSGLDKFFNSPAGIAIIIIIGLIFFIIFYLPLMK